MAGNTRADIYVNLGISLGDDELDYQKVQNMHLNILNDVPLDSKAIFQ